MASNNRVNLKIRDLRKDNSCCGPETDQCCSAYESLGKSEPVRGATTIPQKVTAEWSWRDKLGQIRCRLENPFRMRYMVQSGLYALGEPTPKSEVFVTANYKLSFDILRRSLNGINAWILVLDTKGINVWCAAGKGTFGTEELIRQVSETGLRDLVEHKRLVLPQLGAPGVAAHVVQKNTGFKVHFGPVRSEDIPAYLEAKYKATKEMRSVRFTFWDRLVLTPMEMEPALKKYPLFAVCTFLAVGIMPKGIAFAEAARESLPFLLLGFLSIIAGAFLAPLFLPLIPFRSFAAKGWLAGMATILFSAKFTGILEMGRAAQLLAFVFFPAISSYLALQFTGATAFTGISGVKKELKFALPTYYAAVAISLILLIIFKLGQWGLA